MVVMAYNDSMKKMTSAIRRAITDFNMIEKGDAIAVGVSGGKDSLTLLSVLAELRRFEGMDFTLKALTLEMGFENCSTADIANYCKKIDVEYITQKTDIAQIVFDIRKEKNPCSLCAKMRRGALHQLAKENGCSKVALGHHLDDAVETYFLSLFFEGRISCFSPVTYLDRMDITLLRPMIYVMEGEVRSFAKRLELPIMHNPCPANGNTKREYIKNHIKNLEKEIPGVKELIFGAIKRGLWEKERRED